MIRACYHKFIEKIDYPKIPPFDPPALFPELKPLYAQNITLDKTNIIYSTIRELFIKLKLDENNLKTKHWNPLREFLKKGDHVIIKPNLVLHTHMKGDHGVFWIVSHPSIARVMVDYSLLAVGKTGRITIGDTPLENCDFIKLCEVTGLQKMVNILVQRGHRNIELLDFRKYQTIQYPDGTIETINLSGDPRGYTEIDLGRFSLLQELEDSSGEQNYYTLSDHTINHIDPKTKKRGLPNKYHSSGRHIYRIPNTIIESNSIINIAKLKTHQFAGVTLCLKNAIGISEGKQYLPHRRPGTPRENGDSFPHYPSRKYVLKLRSKRALFSLIGGKNVAAIRSIVRKVIPAKLPHENHTEPLWGNWYGNNTIWRTILDLNLIFFHADKTGLDLNQIKRTFLGIIDGVIGIDHEGPMAGLPVPSNLLIVARDPVAADTLATYLMGFDPRKIPTITGAKRPLCKFLGDVTLKEESILGNISLEKARCKFVPTKGWKEYLNISYLGWPFKD